MTIAIVLGTRPEIIKMSPVIRECEKQGVDYFVLHTGQHYSHNLDGIFFEQLGLAAPRYNLGIGSGTDAEQTARAVVGIEKILLDEKPDMVLVLGDTNTVLAGSLVAPKLHISLGHIEAGLRSYDRSMPEEINRIIADHCSDYLFAPTEKALAILRSEGMPGEKVFMTGNTIVDAVQYNLGTAIRITSGLDSLHLARGEYCLMTLHRRENVDNPARFATIVDGLERVANGLGLPVIYPIHPRARKMADQFGIEFKAILLIEPLDYWNFLQLEDGAGIVLTDSGGVQEEACVLGVPCVTLRDNTERPETVEVGANMLAGANADRIVECATIMLEQVDVWDNPFGDGKAGERIVGIMLG